LLESKGQRVVKNRDRGGNDDTLSMKYLAIIR